MVQGSLSHRGKCRETQGNELDNEFERRKLFSHWLLNVTSSVIGLSRNLSQSQPSISIFKQFPKSKFFQELRILQHNRWENETNLKGEGSRNQNNTLCGATREGGRRCVPAVGTPHPATHSLNPVIENTPQTSSGLSRRSVQGWVWSIELDTRPPDQNSRTVYLITFTLLLFQACCEFSVSTQ